MNRPTERQRRVVRAAAIPAALLASAVVVWQGSYAAFSATTANPTNNWTTGTVSLTDDDAGSAMFTATLLKPTSAGSKCIVVTSNSTVFGPVKMYASAQSSNALSGVPANASEQLGLTVEVFNPGAFTNNAANCTALTGGSTAYSGSIAGLPSTYATGVGTWTPTASGDTRVYRFSYLVPSTATVAVQGQTASAGFTWEIQA